MIESNFTQDISALKKLPKSWNVYDFTYVFSDISGGNKKFLKSDFLVEGKIPVVDQGKNLIAGYTNEEEAIVKGQPPYIVFGDHTRIFKFLDFHFVMGADGTKVFKAKDLTTNSEKYLFHFLKSLNIPDTGYNRHFKYLKSTKIPLPPLPQQQKIANILDTADALRQNDKALVVKYDELIQALFLDMFGDPVSNPKGWEKKEFKEYTLDVKNGITRRPKTEEDNSGDKVLKLKHIRSNFINYDCENRIKLEESEKQKFDVKIGDLLFIRVNGNPDYVGRCALHNDKNQEVYYNDHIMRVRYNLNHYNGLFLSQYLNYPYGQSEISKQIKTSAGQHTINQGGLEKLNLIVPPVTLQTQFAERVAIIEEQKAVAQKSLEKSEELFNSLLQKAFKGELV